MIDRLRDRIAATMYSLHFRRASHHISAYCTWDRRMGRWGTVARGRHPLPIVSLSKASDRARAYALESDLHRIAAIPTPPGCDYADAVWDVIRSGSL